MDISPAPSWATIFYALHEDKFVPKWTDQVPFYQRFIDDVLGVWLCPPDPIQDQEALRKEFCCEMQQSHGLAWECNSPSTTVNFMDLTNPRAGDLVETSLYEKPQNLFLYLPSHSSHPPGQGTGLVLGQILHIRRLCSKAQDAHDRISEFHACLVDLGNSMAPPGSSCQLSLGAVILSFSFIKTHKCWKVTLQSTVRTLARLWTMRWSVNR